MLNVFPPPSGEGAPRIEAATAWIDLYDAAPAELARVEEATGRKLPTFDQLNEIEHSSRLAAEGDCIRLSLPVAHRPVGETAVVHPVGFLLSPHRLVTVRFARLHSFEDVAARLGDQNAATVTAADIFVTLVEAMVDRMADALEAIGAQLEGISRTIFAPEPVRQRPGQTDRALRETLVAVGQCGSELAKIRDSLLGVARMAPFVTQMGRNLIPPELTPRLETVRQDVESLQHHDEQLTDKVQFLLDATLGFISIEQNNIVKLLTVFSMVGIPPTLIAGIYGMNFKNIPELNWTYGYPYSWALMIASAVVPLIWIKKRGWL